MPDLYPPIDIRTLYDEFDAPVTDFDCGEKCAPHNPSGKPFCCDICHAVPVAYQPEWVYLQPNTDLWHAWRGDECGHSLDDPEEVRATIPEGMIPLACLGPDRCQRPFRALSCRQFPFFPYIGSDLRFLGLAYEWEFENSCWVISNLAAVTDRYREEFVRTYEALFERWPQEFNSYVALSEDMREVFAGRRRRIPLLHKNGGYYLISPDSERMRRVPPKRLPKFGLYRQDPP